MNSSSKVVVVSGASRGIGLEIVNRLSSAGFAIAACVRKENDSLEGFGIKKSESTLPDVRVFTFDFSNRNAVKEAALEIGAWKGSVYGLVNCAGIAHGALFSMTKMEDLERVFEVNYFSQMYFTQILAKKMIRAKSGSIVNIASTAGVLADAGTFAYGASKAALIHSTKVMATEMGAYGIRVNAIAPSVVETDMADQMDDRSKTKLNERSALEGLVEAKDVANLACFLLSDESRKISGQVIRLDRGMPF